MQTARQYRLVLCTVEAERDAVAIAQALVSAKLAACVNMVPKIRSIYRWKNSICDEKECLLIIKTRNTHVDKIEKMIQKLHPYDVPEVLSLPIEKGTSPYLRWLTTATVKKGRK